jgi:hypothetical protein
LRAGADRFDLAVNAVPGKPCTRLIACDPAAT